MKPNSAPNKKVFRKDIQTFEELPAKTRELVTLKDAAEKSTGSKRVALNKRIEAKAK